jgi:peptidoglycan hydrolase-like protein with peptidoglycan-binding domain
MKKIIAIIGFFGLFVSGLTGASAAYFNAAPIIRCETSLVRVLSFGSENSEVLTLQTILTAQGYLSAYPNGYFGYQTVKAVRAFQSDNGIMPTGIVGESTRNALDEFSCGGSYASDITYVGAIDPYVQVISPNEQAPAIYATPQNISRSTNAISSNYTTNPSRTSSVIDGKITGTNVVYNPAIGYTYGIQTVSGSVTVTSPSTNSFYSEGDTVFVNWSSKNVASQVYTIILESVITGQTTVVAKLSGNSYSFVLSKSLLDSVCSGACNNGQTGSYRISVTVPTTDIAGNTSTLRAAVTPVTIRRPIAQGTVTITSSVSLVASNEAFKLYVNIPSTVALDGNLDAYSVKIKAICPSVVTVSIAGIPCGQEFMAPYTAIASQTGVPVKIVNGTWYKQDVIFQSVVVNAFGQSVTGADVKVNVNAAPFSW